MLTPLKLLRRNKVENAINVLFWGQIYAHMYAHMYANNTAQCAHKVSPIYTPVRDATMLAVVAWVRAKVCTQYKIKWGI